MKIQFLLISLLFIGMGCQSHPKEHADYTTIKEVFEPHEIEELEHILSFFRTAICQSEKLESEDFLTCYDSYFERMKKNYEAGSIEIQIPYSDQQQLFDKLDTVLFKEIWGSTSMATNPSHSEHFEVNMLNLEGKYMEFLKSYGKENLMVEFYRDKLESAGIITPAMLGAIIMDHERHEIKDKRFQLLVAIHYLTLNEDNKTW